MPSLEHLQWLAFHARITDAFFPAQVADIAPGHTCLVVKGEKMQPVIVEKRSDFGMTFQYGGYCRARSLNQYGKAQRFMDQPVAIVD